jgi:hypothetical protein
MFSRLDWQPDVRIANAQANGTTTTARDFMNHSFDETSLSRREARCGSAMSPPVNLVAARIVMRVAGDVNCNPCQ